MMEALKNGRKINEVDLAKVEKVIADGSMPLAKYYLVHWGSSLTDKETQMALAWAKSQREAFYPNPLADKEWANETVRPIQDSVPVDIRKVILGEMLYNDTVCRPTTPSRAPRATDSIREVSTTRPSRRVSAASLEV